MSQEELILFGDYASQPTRAVYIFCTMNKIPFTFKEVRVLKLEQYSTEFKKINPNAKVPAISDQGGRINIFESHTILRYLHESRQCADHWYPKDLRKRAKVDEYLDWHHNGLRLGAGGYVFRKYVSLATGKPAPKEAIDESLLIIKKALTLMETYWLKDPKQLYLIGNEITLADLSAACELAQINPLKLVQEKDFPKVFAWLNRMLAIPEMKEIHDRVVPMMGKYFKKIDEQTAKEAPKL